MLISGKKGGKSGMTLLRPLILTENGEETEDVKKIYESGAWVD
jgi:tRNA1(Val) A37 N6-methylase TrmN6